MADFFGLKLKEAVDAGRVSLSEIDDHARRILYAEFASGIVDDPAEKRVVDVEKGLDVAQWVEEKSIVLLKNNRSVLPIAISKIHRIAVIGGHSDVGMISGGGSAQWWQCRHVSGREWISLARACLVPDLSAEGVASEAAEREN